MSHHQMPRGPLPIRILMTVLLMRPRVEVTSRALIVSLGWSFRVVVPRGAITSAEAVAERRLSIGAHGWRGRWLVNTATGPLVRVRIDPAVHGRLLVLAVLVRELTLSVEDVDAFLADLG